MVRLTRTVRFNINPPGAEGPSSESNGFAARPSMRGLGRYYELIVSVAGEPDPTTGYILNIRDVDDAARRSAIPLIADACEHRPATDPATLMPALIDALAAELSPSLETLRWRLTPYYSLEMTPTDTAHVLLRQRFDFAAAHRLHVPTLSDEQNRATFGHCNNPAGHGHNYRVEPTVRAQLTDAGPALTLADLERLTDETILKRFDHTHLNEDTPEFSAESGRTPSVENIARVCYDLLAPAIAAESKDRATLTNITVWETDRTSCTYPAE